MISVSVLDYKQLEQHLSEMEAASLQDCHSILDVDYEEARFQLQASEGDCFFRLQYSGKSVEDFCEELERIRLPAQSYGFFLVVFGNDTTFLGDLMEINEQLLQRLPLKDWTPVLGFLNLEHTEEIQVHFITKIFEGMDFHDDKRVRSLLAVLLEEWNPEEEKSCSDILKKMEWSFSDDVLTLCFKDMTRIRVLLSLKKRQLEKSILEYTGKAVSVVLSD
ncbi:MAG: hypothetical protein J6K51_05940 [Clostridia bacterium]|nr:hypothetical protein [Clostridia bacterium]